MPEFDRKKHVYKSVEFEELIKDTIRFFNGTPVHTLPPPEKFVGTGVYAIYYIGKFKQYDQFFDLNRISFDLPIYVGKAVPSGHRQGRSTGSKKPTNELFNRLREHSRSIGLASNLDVEDFRCRFMILEDLASSMIGTVESALIRLYTPLWNSKVDGFGNHDPGSGRYKQAKSDWDVIHPGRKWAAKCQGIPKNTLEEITATIESYFKGLAK